MANQFSSYDVPSYLREGDGSQAFLQGAQHYASMPHQGEKKMVAVDIDLFVRTRDALSSAYMSLSSSIDKAVKAYIDHTNVVLAGDASLNISYLQQPFDQLAHTAHIAQAALHGAAQIQPNGVAQDGKEEPRKKRAYKPRDPNAPKRPLTAYFRYLQEQRGPLGEELKAAAGGVPQKPGDLSKEATERWNKLTKDEQQPYRDAYQRALKDYEKETKKYKAAGGNVVNDSAHAEEGAEMDAEHEDEDEEVVDEEAPAQAKESEEESSSSDDSSDEDELAPPPPPPPKVASPELTKKTPKSSKKSRQAAQDANIDPALAAPTPAATSSSSPERKRKAAADVPTDSDAGGKKKRGRKAAETPAAPVAQMASSDEPAKKKKKRKADGA